MRRFLIFSAAYFAGALYSTAFVGIGTDVTLLWPPSGIAFIAALRYGPRWSLIAVLPVLLVHALFAPVPAAFLPFSVLSNVVGAIVGYYACTRWKDLMGNPLSMRSGFSVLAGGVLMSLTSGLIGSSGLIVADMLHSDAFWPAYAKWALGDLLGIMSLGPVALYLSAPATASAARRRPSERYAPRREKAIWLACLPASYLVIFLVGIQSSAYAYGLIALPLGVLLWSAIRFEPAWSIFGTAVAVVALTTLAGLGMAGFPAPQNTLEAAMLLGSMCVFANVPITLMAAMAQQRAANQRALRQATTDEATGLPNRAAFESMMKTTALVSAGRDQGLAYLDLDHFSVINDTIGHAAGDAMLHGIGSLLRAEVGAHGDVFRIGGDEFALLLEGDAAQVRARIEQVREAIEHYRVGWHGRVLNVTVSIGLVPFRAGDTGRSELLSLADTACFTAKELGGNRVCLANEEDGDIQDRSEAMRWAVRIREALDQGLFELHCQSILPFARSDADGPHIEILLRMRDTASGRLLAPGQFIPAAERFQLGVALDRHVIELALHWFESRPEAAARIGLCAINLTAASMVDESFREFLVARVRGSALPARKLCFEITETSAVRDLSRAQELIAELRALGCAFALDDFGTGFCSFDYLRSLDVDYLKIDGSFIRNLADSALSAAVARAIADIAHVLDKKTIAEQVENEAVLQTLETLGIDYAQGYFLHRPQPLEDYFSGANEPPQSPPQ